MKRPNLKNHLLSYINKQEGWIKKVDLYVVGGNVEYSPESTGRALRELAEEGLIEVDYYNGKWAKNLAKYARKETNKQPTLQEIIKPDGSRVMVLT